MRAYPQELRLQVLHAIDEGQSHAEIVERFHVSQATIKRYVKQRRETGHIRPRPIPGRPNIKGRALQAEIGKQLQASPGAGLAEHARLWEAEHGMQVSSTTVGRAIHALGWTRTPPKAFHQHVA